MPTSAILSESPSLEPLAGVQASATALLGTAAVTIRADGRARLPLTADGDFYRALAVYPAGQEWLLKLAAEVARKAVERGRVAAARHRGMGLAAFPIPGEEPAALVLFTTAGPDADVISLISSDLGLPNGTLPADVPRLDAARVTAALRFFEQTLVLAAGSSPMSAAEVETRRYRVLYAATQSLSRASSEADVLRCLAESLAGILHMDQAIPYTPDAEGWAAHDGVSYWGESVAASRPSFLSAEHEEALGEGQVVSVPSDGASRVRRLLVPVLFEAAGTRHLDAVIALESVHAPRPPLSIELDFALLAARQAALALRAARDAAVQNTLARKLQETLQSQFDRDALPSTNVQELYRPAAQDARVGGDFYDVFPLPDGRVVVVVGDVAGKGVDSAVHTTLARYTLRSYALTTPDPAEILRLTNEALARSREFKDFLTVAIVVLDPKAGRLTYASAGHCPTLLYRRRADAIGSLDSTGTLLGMMPGMKWTADTHKWAPGDALLMYTDGISEAHPPGRFDLFETTRIRDLFAANRHAPPEDVVNAIFQAASEFSEGVMHDDCAMLLVTHRDGG
jgi:sigma-B regulation protein RsbU (phosphoserine phosphatase)